LAAGFLEDDRASCDIPRLQILFPEAVHPSSCNVADIEGRGSQTANGSRLADEVAEEADNLRNPFVNVVRKSGDQHGLDERRGLRDMNRPPVQKRSAAPLPDEQLLARRIVNRANLSATVDLERERRA